MTSSRIPREHVRRAKQVKNTEAEDRCCQIRMRSQRGAGELSKQKLNDIVHDPKASGA